MAIKIFNLGKLQATQLNQNEGMVTNIRNTLSKIEGVFFLVKRVKKVNKWIISRWEVWKLALLITETKSAYEIF